MPGPVITLTTDFGSHGPYLAAMKGVILGINPRVQLVDVSHQIGPQNIREAALHLMQVVPHFSAGTIHLVVVDPGVGTERRLLCASMDEQLFLAPDNGVLSWVAHKAPSIERIEIRERRFWRTRVSPTFHGRDILAPVAAHLSLGVDPNQLGPSTDTWVLLPWPSPVREPDWLEGEVLVADRFGNLITNISQQDLSPLGNRAVSVRCVGHTIGPLVQTYAQVGVGKLLALIGSSDLLEIAVRDGSAAVTLGAQPGTPVLVEGFPT